MTQAGLSVLTSVYLGLFVGGLLFFWLWEDGAPLRPFPDARARRTHALRNLGILASVVLFADIVVGSLLLRVGERLLDPPTGWLAPLDLPVASLIVARSIVQPE